MHIVTMDAVTYVPHREFHIDYTTPVDTLYAPLFSINPDGMQVLTGSQGSTAASQSGPMADSPLHSKLLWAVAGAGVLLLWAGGARNAH